MIEESTVDHQAVSDGHLDDLNCALPSAEPQTRVKAQIYTSHAVVPNLSHNTSPRIVQAANSYRGDKKYLFSVYKKKPMNDMNKV
jgi:hypothetical protein